MLNTSILKEEIVVLLFVEFEISINYGLYQQKSKLMTIFFLESIFYKMYHWSLLFKRKNKTTLIRF